MKKNAETKRIQEQKTVALMIKIYCHGKHNTKGENLCDECRTLTDYASMRTERCPFMESKTFCSNCKVHCYKPQARERIRDVMRYSGVRMLLHHPVLAIKHVISVRKEKKNL